METPRLSARECGWNEVALLPVQTLPAEESGAARSEPNRSRVVDFATGVTARVRFSKTSRHKISSVVDV
jgi:hypothetical protein